MAGEQPKKGRTAYFIYLDENRAKAVAKLGGAAKGVGAVSKLVAEQWGALSDKEKEPYIKQAEVEKRKYEQALADFTAAGGEMIRKRKSDKEPNDTKKKDKDAPKKPAGGGYGQYLAQHRAEILNSLPAGSHALTGVAKEAGARWKSLSDAEKKPYDEQFQTKMAEYRVAMEGYTASGGGNSLGNDNEGSVEPSAKQGRKSEAVHGANQGQASSRGRGRGAGRGAAKSEDGPCIDEGVFAAATELGWASELRNLASRTEVQNLGKNDAELLAALKASNGLVNPARRALLGA